jgi:hypothetical protein
MQRTAKMPARWVRHVSLAAIGPSPALAACLAAFGGDISPEIRRTSTNYTELDRSFQGGGRARSAGAYALTQAMGDWVGTQSYGPAAGKVITGFVGEIFRQPEVLQFPPPTDAQFAPGTTLMLAAIASSGLPVQYSVVSGPASLSGNILTFSAPGVVLVAASAPGNADYAPATSVTNRYAVGASPLVLRIVNKGGPPALELEGGAGVHYEVQESRDFHAWTNVAMTIGLGAGQPVAIPIPSETGVTDRFFRAVEAPAPTVRLGESGSGAGSVFLLSVEAASAQTVTVQASTDLTTWSVVGSVTGLGSGNPVEFPIPGTRPSLNRFFRAIAP